MHLPGCQTGPRGTSVAANLTYALRGPAPPPAFDVLPSPAHLTVAFRRSLILLPKEGNDTYHPRRYHPI